jgi:hypothetical protein
VDRQPREVEAINLATTTPLDGQGPGTGSQVALAKRICDQVERGAVIDEIADEEIDGVEPGFTGQLDRLDGAEVEAKGPRIEGEEHGAVRDKG